MEIEFATGTQVAEGSPSTETGEPADDTTGIASAGTAETDDTTTDAAPPGAPDATDDVSVAPAETDIPDGVPADPETTGQAPADESPDQTPAMPGFEGPTLGAMLDAIDRAAALFGEAPPDTTPVTEERAVPGWLTDALDQLGITWGQPATTPAPATTPEDAVPCDVPAAQPNPWADYMDVFNLPDLSQLASALQDETEAVPGQRTGWVAMVGAGIFANVGYAWAWDNDWNLTASGPTVGAGAPKGLSAAFGATSGIPSADFLNSTTLVMADGLALGKTLDSRGTFVGIGTPQIDVDLTHAIQEISPNITLP